MTSSPMLNNTDIRFDKKRSAQFSRIAEEIFAPVYPVLADYVRRETGIRSGVCVDLGAGPGHLGLALAAQNPVMQVVLCDASEDMLELARSNGRSSGSADRVRVEFGSAEQLPFLDASIRLVVSRGSIFFWDDQVQGMNEIYRILAPGGQACIGGGFGNAALQAQIQAAMQSVDSNWETRRRERLEAQGLRHFETMMKKTRVPDYQIKKTEAGLWICFEK